MERGRFRRASTRDYLPPAGVALLVPACARRCRRPSASARSSSACRQLTRYAWEHAPFYRRKWDEAGFHPDQLRSLEDFEAKVPVVTKQDLRDAQARVPPFGDYLCVPDGEVHHIHGTSGTTGPPDGIRDRPRRLGCDRQRARAHHVGHGHPARATPCSSRRSSACTWARGARSPAPSGCAPRRFRSAPARPGMTARAAMWLDLDEARRRSTRRRRSRCTSPRSRAPKASTRARSA